MSGLRPWDPEGPAVLCLAPLACPCLGANPGMDLGQVVLSYPLSCPVPEALLKHGSRPRLCQRLFETLGFPSCSLCPWGPPSLVGRDPGLSSLGGTELLASGLWSQVAPSGCSVWLWELGSGWQVVWLLGGMGHRPGKEGPCSYAHRCPPQSRSLSPLPCRNLAAGSLWWSGSTRTYS